MTAIHWFRRDLRITDNTALNAAAKTGAPIVPVYIASDWKISHRWCGAPRQEFLCGCLASLAKNLEHLGGRLIVRRGQADAELEKLLRETKASAIFFNRDPDPFGRAMEGKIEAMARKFGVEIHAHQDVAIHERGEVLTQEGEPFRVFTPFARAWAKLPKRSAGARLKKIETPENISSDPLPGLETWGLRSEANIIEPGEHAARARLRKFLNGPIFEYENRRDLPAATATSRLSQDFRFGTLSVREVYSRCREAMEHANAAQRKSVARFINELVWREFYMSVLWHWPEVLEQEFDPKFRGLRWSDDEKNFARWCAGETGFPIVDAAVRQLHATGFMHNRLRMIVAMFLTKDLHIDWRAGEQFFMQRLVDGEIAANNGGWQWSAGTGADAAPYFRIQNPWTQTRRYDPKGEFIKRWLPELRAVDERKFFAPPPEGQRLAKNYPPPMCDHAHERERTLEIFKTHARKNA